jgi:PAS domain S-box-containing protein/putative nucleotidyltransferase with HDIG domain
MDYDGKVAYWNQAAERTFGYTSADIVGKDLHTLLAPAHYLAAFQQGFVQFRDTGQGAAVGRIRELEARHRNGTEVPIELSLASVMQQGRWYAVGIMRDITARKAQEQKLVRVNRALKTLSACNSVVVHASSEENLLSEMCRVIVEVGGYRSVWVGFAESDAAKSVHPVAWAGEGGAFLRRLDISWTDTIRGRGPTGRSIRSGAPQVARDIGSDPTMLPWREEALQFGFRSSVSLPLAGPAGVFGVLVIYAHESDAFDADELALLSEMAGDLSYGILALRTAANHLLALLRIERGMEVTVHAIASTVETRDPYTAGHQRRVAVIASAIAKELGYDDDMVRGLALAASIHDIGKINVPAEILSKPGQLTPIEFELIKTHAEAGYQIMKDVEFPWPVAEVIRQHHERLDGSGYPRGLTANQILLQAKILAVADVVEAMSSPRPYRPGKGLDAALGEIASGRGRLFDAAAVDACLKLFRERDFRIAGWEVGPTPHDERVSRTDDSASSR